MAPKRRGGSGAFRPPELKGTLGTLLRTAIQQAGGVRDALTRGAQQGREKIDELRADRRRQEALADLGEIVLDLIRRGEIDVTELPEARDLIRTLDDLDAEAADDDVSDITTTQPFNRQRFDDRGGSSSSRTPARSPSRPPARPADDGTVSSGARWSPSSKVAPPAEAEAAPPRRGLTMPKDPHRKGGISFEDDDLGDYMHPDDVPPKEPKDDE